MKVAGGQQARMIGNDPLTPTPSRYEVSVFAAPPVPSTRFAGMLDTGLFAGVQLHLIRLDDRIHEQIAAHLIDQFAGLLLVGSLQL